jgi:HPr kinase/phosphorylase
MSSKRSAVRTATKQDPRRYSQDLALPLKRFYDEVRRECGLRPCYKPFSDVAIISGTLNRPGLALAGFTQGFLGQSIQLIGETEWAFYKSLSPAKRKSAFDAVFSARVPAIVFSDAIQPEEGIVACAQKSGVALFETDLSSDAFCELAGEWLRGFFAERTSVHGTLVDVHGVGILYVGKSGIGKSECALDLICNGNVLISDDVVHILRRGNSLIGECNELLGHHMEIRGIGIINIKDLCGMRSIRSHNPIDVQVELVEWSRFENFDRTGLDEKTITILGVTIPHIRIPVSTGKNISAISEILALHLLWRRKGKSTIKELNKKLISHMKLQAPDTRA